MKASILLITYNHEAFIEDAINSILTQKGCTDFEIILSDDCSGDATFEKATAMLLPGRNVTLHQNKANLGITKNYQQAFKKCKGEYIFVLEGDDYWTDEYKMKIQIDFLDGNRDCVMCGHPFFVLRNSNVVPYGIEEEKDDFIFFTSEELIQNEGIVSNFSTCCYRRSALEKISERVYSVTSYDWMINISIGQFGMLGKINRPMSFYRISANNAWANKSEYQQTVDLYEIIEQYDSVLSYKYSHAFNKKQKELEEKINMYSNSISNSLKQSSIIRKSIHSFLNQFRK